MSFIKSNYHLHSTFCDGKNTLEEMTLTAIDKGFKSIGFSSHAMFPWATDWHLNFDNAQNYKNEILSLKEKYHDQIDIYFGFEADYIPTFTFPGNDFYKELNPDYLIGSVHFVGGKRGTIEADGSPDTVKDGIKNYFGGSVKKAVQEYFFLEREMLKKSSFTFLGHPDLIKKQNAKQILFDENSLWYKKEIKTLVKEIAAAGVCVEVNTGGIARGYGSVPYPGPYFMEQLKQHNIPLTVNTDCHQIMLFDAWYDKAIEYVKSFGYSELCYLDDGKLKFQHI